MATLFASAIKNRTSQHTTKVFNRACKADPKEKLFLKNSIASKKIEHPTLKPNKKAHSTNDSNRRHKNGFNPRQTRTPAYNSTYKKLTVYCFV
jgi:hypothetical protein